MNYHQGDILFINLEPVKGHEQGRTRPSVVVSNDFYNEFFNTVVVAPISSSKKYQNSYFLNSPFYLEVPKNDYVHGTILLQHVRTLDLNARNHSEVLYRLPKKIRNQVSEVVTNMF